MAFLPVTQSEVRARGWDAVDFVCVTGDAYVDHPSFGIAIISRLLERLGYRVAVLAQPEWHSEEDFRRFGRPRLAFMITAGNIDSMVSNYTVAKRRRKTDAYSPAGAQGRRPDYAAAVYSRLAKKAWPDCPVILGGIEASLRRFAHYDYWSDSVMPSILSDSGADLISYGMGERQTEEIARRLASGEPVSSLTDIRGTACWATPDRLPAGCVSIASFEKVREDKKAFAKAYGRQLAEQDPVSGRAVVQKHGSRLLLQNPPALCLTREELDEVFTLPFERTYHPCYEELGGVAAIQEVEFSIMHNRGCFGHCNFCSIACHQGRQVVSRSIESVVKEAEALSKSPRFKGYIHDVGGPTAQFRYPSCEKQLKAGLCPDRKCLGTKPCPNLRVDHSEYLALLRRLRAIPGVKKVFIRSGIRFDYLLLDRDPSFFRELLQYHVSGQLKVAPEHCSPNVLDLMGKPRIEVYERFAKQFYRLTKEIGKEQYLVPYLISSHPGSTLADAVSLACFLKKNHMRPEQVQDFYPTPDTISTCMFHTGIDPLTGKEVYVPREPRDKQRQRALLQYYKPENRRMVIEALEELGRRDLIGTGPDCLVPPDRKYILDHRKDAPDRREGPGGRPGKTGRRSPARGKAGRK